MAKPTHRYDRRSDEKVSLLRTYLRLESAVKKEGIDPCRLMPAAANTCRLVMLAMLVGNGPDNEQFEMSRTLNH